MYNNSEFTEETVWEQLRFIAHLSVATLAVVSLFFAVIL
jgi:hypothetical protein